MKDKDMTLEEILEIENKAFIEADSKYGRFFRNAMDFNNLLNHSIKEADPDGYIFIMFFSQVKKYHLLSILSFLRRHHIQGMLDLRQMLEAGSNAAYGLGVPDHTHYVKNEDNGTISTPQSLMNKRYKWLDKNYPKGSEVVKRLKDNINNSCAHSNMIYVFNNFEMYDKDRHAFGLSYFDKEDEYMIKTDLWFAANIAMLLIDLFYGVNKDFKRIKFVEEFNTQLKELESENLKLKEEMTKHPRYIATQERNNPQI